MACAEMMENSARIVIPQRTPTVFVIPSDNFSFPGAKYELEKKRSVIFPKQHPVINPKWTVVRKN